MFESAYASRREVQISCGSSQAQKKKLQPHALGGELLSLRMIEELGPSAPLRNCEMRMGYTIGSGSRDAANAAAISEVWGSA
ncbi:hypothetical protein BSZ21_26340 [Bradyrhizobium canariense]|nr:hypothetical protein BSZ21_26340 [Bradyrhizobium canariense]